MNNAPDSIFDIFIPECDCENCSETRRKPFLFTNIFDQRDGTYVIDTASLDHKHLEGVEYTSPFDALRVIRANGLTFVGMF